MVLIFTAGNRHLFKVIFFKLKSAWILLILAAERGGGEHEPARPVFVHPGAGFQWGPASERCGMLPVRRDHSSRLSCWSVLSVLAPTVAGQHRCLIVNVILSSFSHSAGTGMDGECLAAEKETCRVVFLPMCKPSLDPFGGWPRLCLCAWVDSTLSVGDSLALWVLAVVLGPVFGISCAGSITFPCVQAAALL